jgi:phosphoadenosine phosphosulfate reductase
MTTHTDTQAADAKLMAAVAQKTITATDFLCQAARDFAPAAFSTSLGAEDMVVLDLIARNNIGVAVFSLDTGRLPAETHDLLAEAERHYGRRIQIYYPRHELVEAFVADKGINGFYDSIEARKACCYARKVEPLQRALKGQQGWVTGLRAEQSATRASLQALERDEALALTKINPLHDWSEREVWAYLRANRVPYNKLHDRGYPSIGCAPCTRAIASGEDVRAGRWWWETPETKECGLHLVDGKLQRVKKAD